MGEYHVFLQQRMGAHQHVQRAFRQFLQNFTTLRRFGIACQYFYGNTGIFKKFCQRFQMLLGQNARRRHDAALKSVFRNFCQCQGRDDSLTAAHVALQQAMHRLHIFHVAGNIRPGFLLGPGQRKRKILQNLLHQLPVPGQFNARPSVVIVLPVQHQPALKQKQFFIHQTLFRRAEIRCTFRKMNVAHRFDA